MTMSEEKIKYICITHRCGWKGISTEVLKELNPFDEREIILGCPKCKDVNTVVLACDEADCWEKADCGFPTGSGYRRTCYSHYQG